MLEWIIGWTFGQIIGWIVGSMDVWIVGILKIGFSRNRYLGFFANFLSTTLFGLGIYYRTTAWKRLLWWKNYLVDLGLFF